MSFWNDTSTFKSRLQRLIEAAGSCNALSFAAGMPVTTLQAYVRANRPVQPSVEKINVIAQRLRIDPSWLAFGRGRAPDFEKVAILVATQLASRRFKHQEERLHAVA